MIKSLQFMIGISLLCCVLFWHGERPHLSQMEVFLEWWPWFLSVLLILISLEWVDMRIAADRRRGK